MLVVSTPEANVHSGFPTIALVPTNRSVSPTQPDLVTGPASAIVGSLLMITSISSVSVQLEPVTVHLSFNVSEVIPVTVDVGEFGVVITSFPFFVTNDHVPVSDTSTGVAGSVKLVALGQIPIAVPAFAFEGLNVTITVSVNRHPLSSVATGLPPLVVPLAILYTTFILPPTVEIIFAVEAEKLLYARPFGNTNDGVPPAPGVLPTIVTVSP